MTNDDQTIAARPTAPRGNVLSAIVADCGLAPRPVEPAVPQSASDPLITGTTLDSRTARPGDLYLALAGATTHGAHFAAQAAAGGAVAAITDAAGRQECEEAGLVTVVVADPRAAAGPVAAAVYGHPAERLRTVGITGTNGKTSVSYMVASAWRHMGRTTCMIGTNGSFYGAREPLARIATARTTPEATELEGILARALEDGATDLAMEVSSIALDLHRVDGVVFDLACFTNLTQDHLAYHRTMEAYFRAKALLFTPEHARAGIVCIDDEWGRRLAGEATIPVTTYSLDPASGADVTADDLRPGGYGLSFTLRIHPRAVPRLGGDGTRTSGTSRAVPPEGLEIGLTAPIPGRHYAANTVLTALVLLASGAEAAELPALIAAGGIIPGRMQPVAQGNAAGIIGVVDYSHTEDALAKALAALRPAAGPGRVITVMGAGGDRDRGKRPHMGAVAAAGADLVIVTDDNPRTEEPTAIRAQVLAGIPESVRRDPTRVVEIASRREAIEHAVAAARPGDVVLVAGKGAETGQTIGQVVHPFDDRTELAAAIATVKEQA